MSSSTPTIDLDPDVAAQLFERGAFLLFLDIPQGLHLEFGIDYNTWKTGPRFKGLKLIPPGLHFVYYSVLDASGEVKGRDGFFKFFKEKEIVVKRWNAQLEDLFADEERDPEQLERFRHNIREFDPFLGVYPLKPTQTSSETSQPSPTPPLNPYHKWLRLTTHITPRLLERVLPAYGRISSMTSVSRFSDVPEGRTDLSDVKFKGEGTMDVDDGESGQKATSGGEGKDATKITGRKGNEYDDDLRLNFTPIDLKRSFPKGATGMDVTRYSMDKSYLLNTLLDTFYADAQEVLGELQLSFVIFLMGQVYDGFEQWKCLIHLLCRCDEAVSADRTKDLFLEFIDVLQIQLEECPEDFFADILSSDNFVKHTLRQFVSTLREEDDVQRTLYQQLHLESEAPSMSHQMQTTSTSSTSTVNDATTSMEGISAKRTALARLSKRVDRLLDFLRTRFEWDLAHD
ncbi:a1-alpha2 repression, partial [Quaeritorhiza haematococci]